MKAEREAKEQELQQLKATPPKDLWLADIEVFEESYDVSIDDTSHIHINNAHTYTSTLEHTFTHTPTYPHAHPQEWLRTEEELAKQASSVKRKKGVRYFCV